MPVPKKDFKFSPDAYTFSQAVLIYQTICMKCFPLNIQKQPAHGESQITELHLWKTDFSLKTNCSLTKYVFSGLFPVPLRACGQASQLKRSYRAQTRTVFELRGLF